MSEEHIPFEYNQSVVQNQSLLETSISKLSSHEEKMRILGETIRRQQENSILLSPRVSLFHRKPAASASIPAGVTKPQKMTSAAARSTAAIRGTTRPSTLAAKAATGMGKQQQTKTQIDKENTQTQQAIIRPKWSTSTRVAVEHTRPQAPLVTRSDLSKENTLANTRPIKPQIEPKATDAQSKGSNGLASSAQAKPMPAEQAPTKTAKSSVSKTKSSSSTIGCGGIPFIPRKAATVGKAPVLGDKSRIKRVGQAPALESQASASSVK